MGRLSIAIDWLRLSRAREWAQSKFLYIAGAALLVAPASPMLLLAIATVIPWAAFGYGVNDVADRACDERAGKRNRAAALGPASLTLFLLLTAGAAFGLSLSWAADTAGPVLVLGGLALAVAYVVPPIRLKERGALGLVAAAVAQWGLPALAVSAVEPGGWLRPAAWSASLLGVAIGIRWMVVHQIQDNSADRKAGVRTFATAGGALWPVIAGAFLSELALLALTLALTWQGSMPAVAALAVWLLHRVVIGFPRGSLRGALQTYQHAPLAEYYFLLMPVALALGRTPSSPVFLGAGLIFLVLGSRNLMKLIRDRRA